MNILSFDDLIASKWKNGGGTTRELAVYPEGAPFDSLLWRVSIADIAESGPFSVFAGLDRVIVLLEGDGINMVFENGTTHDLKRLFEPYRFPGEEPVVAHLAGGRSRDFNIMLRRGVVTGQIHVWRKAATLECSSGNLIFFSASGEWEITSPQGDRYRSGFQQALIGNCQRGQASMRPLAPESVLLGINLVTCGNSE